MPEPSDHLRAGDADREHVAERLRTALNEGRLTLAEYDERLGQVYAARTYGELRALLADLPPVAPAGRGQVVPFDAPAPVPARGYTRRWIVSQWTGWVKAGMIMTVIWALSGIHSYYWPGWVLGVWGAVILATIITGLARGEPRRQAEREVRRQIERAERKRAEREAEQAEREEQERRADPGQDGAA